MNRKHMSGKVSSVSALTLAALLVAGPARGQIITGNHTGFFSDATIQTNNFGAGGTFVGSFLPTGASPFGTGRGVEVAGNRIYYTEVTGGVFLPGPTDFIRIAPYNGGAGGADIGSLANPRPGSGVQNIDYDSTNGILYVLTGYIFDNPPKVYGLDPVTGAIVRGPVDMAVPGGGGVFTGPASADGFTLLPNGNFLINNFGTSCTYNEYAATTGALIPGTTIVVPGASSCTGVDTDGTFLYFQTNFDSYTKTTLAGALIAVVFLYEGAGIYDISVQKGFPGIPGDPNCHGKTVSALTKLYGGMASAAVVLGYASEADLQAAITAYCGK